jgi:hypothetical protein
MGHTILEFNEQEVKWLHYHHSNKTKRSKQGNYNNPNPHPPTQTPRILEPLEYNFGILEKDKKGTITTKGHKDSQQLPNHPLATNTGIPSTYV